ncbi:hypothetical protein HanPI659440_Chr04g0181561 [Helianthus annuus]|nr:hypothetical protein HanPI659440_Chr04g0181561 [Helianthus annuus]
MQGFKRGSSVLTQFSVPQIRKKVSNSFSAVEDTFLSTKETFERHKVVFTILTSIASVGTAWVGMFSLLDLYMSIVIRVFDILY